MHRGTTFPLLLAALAAPGAAHALGLGEIHVDSALGEPLAARIELVGVTAEDLRSLRAGIADASFFQRANADRPDYLSSVHFQLDADAAGQPLLLLRSDAPFTDPLVELLVDVRWRNGELVRDFPLLLDPAVGREPVPPAATLAPPPVPATPAATARFATGPVAPRDAAPRSPEPAPAVASGGKVTLNAAAKAPAPPPAATTQPSAPPAPAANPVAASSVATVPARSAPVAAQETAASPPAGSTYQVKPGDTLFAIVHRAGASTRDDVARLMIAVFNGNPQAFDGNINQLRRDARLVVPPLADVAGLDAEAAHREVARQTRDWLSAAPWRNKQSSAAPADNAPPAPAVPAAPTASAAPVAVVPVEAAATPVASDPVAAPAATMATPDDSLPPPEVVARDLVAEQSAAEQALAAAASSAPAASPEAAPPAAHATRSSWQRAALWTAGAGALLWTALAWWRRRARAVGPKPGDANDEVAIEPRYPASTSAVRPAPWVQSSLSTSRSIIVEEPTIEMAPLEETATVRLPSPEEGTTQMLQATQPMPDPQLGETAEMTAHLEAPALAAVSADEAIAADLETAVLEGLPPDETATLDATAVRAGAAATSLDYNLLDLDAADQHVQLPSDLHSRADFVERRTSVADALRAAISRDPSRSDLKLKLLETYYAQAASNLRAFADFVGLQGAEPASLTDADWRRVEQMGRDLGLELEVPDVPRDDDLANCA